MDILGGIFNAAKGVVGFANNLLNGGSKPAPHLHQHQDHNHNK